MSESIWRNSRETRASGQRFSPQTTSSSFLACNFARARASTPIFCTLAIFPVQFSHVSGQIHCPHRLLGFAFESGIVNIFARSIVFGIVSDVCPSVYSPSSTHHHRRLFTTLTTTTTTTTSTAHIFVYIFILDNFDSAPTLLSHRRKCVTLESVRNSNGQLLRHFRQMHFAPRIAYIVNGQ